MPTTQPTTNNSRSTLMIWVGLLLRALLNAARAIARCAWWYRSELFPVAAAVGVGLLTLWGCARLSVPHFVAQVLAAVLAAPTLVVLARRVLPYRPVIAERRLWERLRHGLRHDWPDVMRANRLGGVAPTESLPSLKTIELIAGGFKCVVSLPRSIAPADFERAAASVASDLSCVGYSLAPGANLSEVVLSLFWLDPLASSFAPSSAFAQPFGTDICEPAPVGVYEDDSPALIAIYQRHLLCGGAAGSGKSVFLQLLLGWSALADNTRLFLLDAKGGVELGFWQEVAELSGGRFAVTQEDGIAVLDELIELMRARLSEMRERGIRKHVPTFEEPQVVLFIDELAAFTQGLDKKQAQEFNARLYTLTAQGRAAAISVIAATQKPTIETVGAARDLFHYRVAFSCPTPSMSDVILGEGQASAGADASTIPQGASGVGYVLAEGDKVARRFRAFYLADEDLEALAARCASARLDRQFELPPLDGFPVTGGDQG